MIAWIYILSILLVSIPVLTVRYLLEQFCLFGHETICYDIRHEIYYCKRCDKRLRPKETKSK